MSVKTSARDLPTDAKFLFKGTVQKLGASTLAQVPRDEQTAIVHVDEIMHAPPALAKTLDKQITVKLAKGPKPKVGEQVLFHANGWLFGDTVAVESVKQEKPPTGLTMLAERVSDPVRNFADRELQNRVADAQMVIEGEVSSVHLPQSESLFATRAASPPRPVSEHDPKWREAVITVGAVHKGDPATKQVVVRFPSSTDVRWHRAPKFHTGDRGIWLLQSPEGSPAMGIAAAGTRPKALAMAETAIPGAAVYTALNPMDFQSANKVASLAPVIRAAMSQPPSQLTITAKRSRQIKAKVQRKTRARSRAKKLPPAGAANS